MIENSFIILQGIGRKKEESLWRAGINTWKDFINTDIRKVRGVSAKRKVFYDRILKFYQNSLCNDDVKVLSKAIPKSEHWRVWEKYKGDALFIDIETDARCRINVIGLYNGRDLVQLVEGINLDKRRLNEMIKDVKLAVTFNGLSFDIPIINKYFGSAIRDVFHIDLRHLCSRLGMIGGLKIIEQELDISRDDLPLDNTSKLWDLWRHSGDKAYLKKLLDYNADDTINLKPIMEWCYTKAKNRTTKMMNGAP